MRAVADLRLIYSHAVLLANLTRVVPVEENVDALCPMIPQTDAVDIIDAFDTYKSEYLPRYKGDDKPMRLETYVKTYILRKYNLPDDIRLLDCLYHPSMVETFPKVYKEDEKKGCLQLGSPRTNSVRNPMAMHSLFRLRRVVNTLLAKGVIDKDTIVHIEFARELNDANHRAALRDWQRQKEKRHKEYADKIREAVGEDYTPTDDDILKYELWEEQNHLCLYTGETIRLSDLLNAGRYDIEHTIPRSVGGDSTMVNMTICQSRFNREVKRAQLPSQLANHEDILERIGHWKDKVADLDRQITRAKAKTKQATTKEGKDACIRKRHLLTFERDYWRDKYESFTMSEVPEGFARRQGVDISVISRYGREYLKSVFSKVYVVKGKTTSDFRKIWGLQNEYEKKARVNHCHHAIDAITIACIGKAEYDMLAKFYHEDELWHNGNIQKRATFPKPWTTFTEDVKAIEQSLIVSHYSRDNMRKHTRKRIHGTKDEYMQGDTARGSLHLDTYYGAIERDGEVKYVVRRNLDMLTEKDIVNIVDDAVRQRVLDACKEHGSLKKAVEEGIWMNREKDVAIKKVRCYVDFKKLPGIRTHRDELTKEYKRVIYADPGENYAVALYEGTNDKVKILRDVKYVTNLDAALHYRNSSAHRNSPVFPECNENGIPLKCILKSGMMVLLYENTADELYECTQKELQERLYKIVVLAPSNKRIILVHHQEARPSKEQTPTFGKYTSAEFHHRRVLRDTQFHALVEGQDFTIDEDGELIFKHR